MSCRCRHRHRDRLRAPFPKFPDHELGNSPQPARHADVARRLRGNRDIFSGTETGHGEGNGEGDGDGRACSVALFFGGRFFGLCDG